MSGFQTNSIFIQGGSFTDVKKALCQWIDSYSSQLDPDFIFKIYRNGHGKHVIHADERLDNSLFYYLVNYINYPENIDYKVKVEGFTIGTEKDKLKGKQLLVFISDFDTEYDNVMVVTENNDCYKMDFGGRLSKIPETRLYIKTSFNEIEAPETLKVIPKKNSEILEEGKLDKRLKWMFIAIVGLHVFNFLIVKPFSIDRTLSFENVPFLLFIGMSLWFFWDYKLLRSTRRYLKCFGLTCVLLIYVYILAETELLHVSKYEMAVAIFPLIFLLLQWPLRLFFIYLFDREPKIEYRPDSFSNAIYGMILSLGTIFLSLSLVR